MSAEQTGRDRKKAALAAATAKRRDATTARIEAALREMRKEHAPINVSAVARRAGVTRPTIHSRPELRARIEKLTNVGSHAPTEAGIGLNRESTVIAALRRQMRDQAARHRAETVALRSQIRELEHKLEVAVGKLIANGRGR